MRKPFSNRPRIISAGARLVAPDAPRVVIRPKGHTPQTVQEDLARVIYLPVLPLNAPRCQDKAYEADLMHRMCPKDFSLRQVQVDAIWTYEQEGGLLAPIGCGHGKTLISFGAAKVAHTRRGHRAVALIVPPEVLSQLRNKDLPMARRVLDLDDCMFHFVTDDAENRMKVAKSKLPGIYVLTYSTISTTSGFDTLLEIGATAYILDEAHKLASPRTARTKRWMSAVAEIERNLPAGHPGIDVLAMSGTLTRKKVEEYAHLAKAALRERSPLPVTSLGIDEWGGAIDADSYSSSLGPSIIRQLIQWAATNGATLGQDGMQLTVREIAREAHQYRLRTAPGVVATSDVSVDCSLILSWSEPRLPATPEGARLKLLMTQVIGDLTPDGDEIDWAMHRFKWLWELSGGFYNSLTWPTTQQVARKGISEIQAAELIYKAQLHHQLLQTYHKHLRAFLNGRHVPKCDTPMLVGLAIKRILDGHANDHGLEPELIQAWRNAKAAHEEGMPVRISVPVRVCDYKIKAAVEWAKEHKKGLMWHHHPEVGRWLCEELTKAGIKHTYAPAGNNEAAFAEGLVVCSYAHDTGKNLQHQSNQVFVELRREANHMEQVLARTHRPGQLADEVLATMLIANGFDLAMFNSCLADADYVQSSTGSRQKLCFASYSPMIPPTNPRLYLKLGIIVDSLPTSIKVEAFEQITDDDAAASLFRPSAYGR